MFFLVGILWVYIIEFATILGAFYPGMLYHQIISLGDDWIKRNYIYIYSNYIGNNVASTCGMFFLGAEINIQFPAILMFTMMSPILGQPLADRCSMAFVGLFLG